MLVTASLRATAMAACMKPILSRSTRPHVRRVLLVDLRISMTVSHLGACCVIRWL